MGVIGVRSMTVRSALNSMSELARLHPEVPHYRNDLAKCHFDRAGVLNRTGRREEALRSYQAAAELRRVLVRDNPEQATWPARPRPGRPAGTWLWPFCERPSPPVFGMGGGCARTRPSPSCASDRISRNWWPASPRTTTARPESERRCYFFLGPIANRERSA